jgi:hypothetical protein
MSFFLRAIAIAFDEDEPMLFGAGRRDHDLAVDNGRART